MRVPSAGEGYPPNGLVPGDWAPDGPTAAGALDLMTGAAVLGARVWVERELHRIVGSWATTAEAPRLAVAFDRVAVHHASRAEVLFARLPALRELPAEPLVVAGGPGTRRLLDALVLPGDDRARVQRWLAVALTLREAHEEHFERSTPAGDASLRRHLPAVIAGLASDIDELCGVARSVGGTAAIEPDPDVARLAVDSAALLD